MLVQGWPRLQPACPLVSFVGVTLSRDTRGGVVSHPFRPQCLPLPPTGDVASELAVSQWDLPKTSVWPGVLPQLGAVPVVLHKFPLTWMHEKQILFRPELMVRDISQGSFILVYSEKRIAKSTKQFKIWDKPFALSEITRKSSGYDWMTILWPELLQISLLP